MYLKGEKSTREIVIREVNGQKLEAPITAIFSQEGIAKVKDGVGELLLEALPGLSVHKTKDKVSEETVEE
jgi:hypothetical protein